MKKLAYIVTILFTMLHFSVHSQIRSNSSGNWSNPSTWVGNTVPNLSTDDVEIISGHSITITSTTTVRDITITDGSVAIGSNTLKIYGVIKGNQKNNISSNTNSEIEILGNASIFEFPSNIQKLKKITMNRPLGASSDHSLDLDDGVPADGIVLSLANGILYMNNSSILYLNSKQIQANIPASDSSHVDGIVQRNIPKDSGIYTFPVGNKGHFRPFGIGMQNGNGDNINEVQLIWDTPINNSDINYNNLPGGIIQDFYWRHAVISGGNPQRRLYYEEEDFPNVSKQDRINSMTLANTDGSNSWDKATTPWSVVDSTQWIQFDNSNNSNSSYWTLGSILGNVNYEGLHLPIKLVSFDAEIQNKNTVALHWVTAQEHNSDFYVIQKSFDGVTFFAIDTIDAIGFSSEFTYYESLDNINDEAILYYKLIEYDIDGSGFESEIIQVEIPFVASECNVSILPQKNMLQITIKQLEKNKVKIMLVDIKGNISYVNSTESENADFFIPLTKIGMYFVQVSYTNKVTTYPFMH